MTSCCQLIHKFQAHPIVHLSSTSSIQLSSTAIPQNSTSKLYLTIQRSRLSIRVECILETIESQDNRLGIVDKRREDLSQYLHRDPLNAFHHLPRRMDGLNEQHKESGDRHNCIVRAPALLVWDPFLLCEIQRWLASCRQIIKIRRTQQQEGM